uniref:Reverse transcriptase zinc-binding domain-containing protein n=1 Tax=Fagus sylvatica TaxID=28930 RepID=A0A2N9HSC8_FAGSY
MGFCDLHAFNMALLAKQGWRLLHNPHSLFYRVFKAKYFHQSSFLQAKLGSHPSYIWTSFMAAQPLLKAFLWVMGLLVTIFFGTIHPKRTFTVASAYRQAIKTNDDTDVAEHSRASTTYQFWHGLWKAQVSKKCKQMMWRACRNTLPTLLTLGGCGVPIDATCKICSQSSETLTHALWRCPLAFAQCSTNEELQEWFMISWAVWDARNRYVFDNTQLQPTTILSTTLKYLEDFKKVVKSGASGFLSIA